ncbi:hypothetical protein dsx2_3252 [Desulfovibrio sp. X2]|uniref:hypothetical protein n=1 Tax=Desulfovibrio sp. X2 TaxID=941449 RepID=UPI0003586ED5|nr:hypothetical protein [Desulfovibrio sp. X2]EPR41083.1 hypothetical protein dsx2_3252 [Desulfovibrio sp. X2]
MTLDTTTNRVQYPTDGQTKAFAVPFEFLKDTDLVVIVSEADGSAPQTLTLGTDYLVGGGNGATGTVTCPASGDPLAAGKLLTVLRELIIVQDTDVGGLAGQLEREIDRSRMIDQQLQEQIDRCVKSSPSAGTSLSYDDFAAARDEALAARDAAQAAQAGAETAQSAAQNAQTGAEAAKDAAETARDEAQSAANGASSAKDAAEAARDAAQTAQTGAEAAQSAAETARDEALAFAAGLPSGTGHGGEYMRQKTGEDGLEYRTAEETRADLGLGDLATRNAADLSLLPAGVIVLWSGAVSAVPTGWALCDGTNGAPDLRNRFVVGAGSGYAVGATGGEATHTLTQAEMPVHTHTGSSSSAGAHTHTISPVGVSTSSDGTWDLCTGGDATSAHQRTTQSAGAHSHTMSLNNAGSGGAHENRPPYYALCYIMKL